MKGHYPQRWPRYYVTIWDHERQRFTPQEGVRTGPYTLMGLRRALRALKGMGYDIGRGFAPSVLVIRKDSPEEQGT